MIAPNEHETLYPAPTECIPGRSPNSRNRLTGPRVTLRSIGEQGSGVAKVGPYYTITPESGEPRHRDVYHDHDDCSDGQRILPKHKVRGMGGHPKCDECKSLGKL